MGAFYGHAFAWLELAAVGAALGVRHAGDGERIVLNDGRLIIELETAGRTRRSEFTSGRVEPGQTFLIEVCLSRDGRSFQAGMSSRT
jgi:hypothetical protein